MLRVVTPPPRKKTTTGLLLIAVSSAIVGLAAFSCRKETPPPPAEVNPLDAIPLRPPKTRTPLGAGAIATRVVLVETPAAAAAASTVVVGMAGKFYGVDAKTGVLRWQRPGAPLLFRPMTEGARLLLPHVEKGTGVVADVDPVSGKTKRETRLTLAHRDTPGAIGVTLNTAPTAAGNVIVWPSSASLYGFALDTGKQLWRYDSEGPTPYRRFQFGSEPALVDAGTAYWAHQRGLAAVDVATGKARWAWPGFRGFALRPVLSAESVFTTSDKEVVALDRASGQVRWMFAPEQLRFEHLAGEDMAGYSNGVYWFVGEPIPFHYWLLFLDAKTGKGRASAELFGRGLIGSIASDGLRLYARLGEWLIAYELATAKPIWRLPLGGVENGSSPKVAGGRVWIVDSNGNLIGADASK